MKPTAIRMGLENTWGTLGQKSYLVPLVNKSGGGGTPPIEQGGGGGGGGHRSNVVPCPPGCGCHPLWYLGTGVGVMLVLTVLLARA